MESIDNDLYSRQQYVLGAAAMLKMAKSRVFLSGLGVSFLLFSSDEAVRNDNHTNMCVKAMLDDWGKWANSCVVFLCSPLCLGPRG